MMIVNIYPYAFIKYLYEFTAGHIALDFKTYICWIFELVLRIDIIFLSHIGDKKYHPFLDHIY